MAIRAFRARHFQARTLIPLAGLDTYTLPFPLPQLSPWLDDGDDTNPLPYPKANTTADDEATLTLLLALACTLMEP
jgi:hypothetical protein